MIQKPGWLILFILIFSLTNRGTLQNDVLSRETSIMDQLRIEDLLQVEIQGSEIVIEQILDEGFNYSRYIASYTSEGNKIYGLLTIPYGDIPENGFKAIVFVHGYIPPGNYITTERYVAYVDTLAQNGFLVFKIDLRGHGNSEGLAQGSYFSPDYTIDAISALKSLQTLPYVDPQGIGIWGHSMAGNLVLRAMLIEPEIQAGVIWAGAVYSYDDFGKYAISDPSFVRSENPPIIRSNQQLFDVYGRPDTSIPFWRDVSLTNHIDLLQNPVQIHHALDDAIVNIGYSLDLGTVLAENGKRYELHQYNGGGHNIASPYLEQAMERTVLFFRENL